MLGVATRLGLLRRITFTSNATGPLPLCRDCHQGMEEWLARAKAMGK